MPSDAEVHLMEVKSNFGQQVFHRVKNEFFVVHYQHSIFGKLLVADPRFMGLNNTSEGLVGLDSINTSGARFFISFALNSLAFKMTRLDGEEESGSFIWFGNKVDHSLQLVNDQLANHEA